MYYNGRKDLQILFEYTVPFLKNDNHTIGDISIFPAEEDEYGRTLGILQFNSEYNNVLFADNSVYCILQSGSETESCFFEDICCVMVKNDADATEAINQLKQENAWDLPPDNGKCRTIPIRYYSMDGAYSVNSIYPGRLEEPASEAVDWPADHVWIEVLCKDGCGMWLFTLVQDYREAGSPVCLVMMKEDSSQKEGLSIIGTHLLENRDSPWREIHTFKDDMGWAFADSVPDQREGSLIDP